VSDSANNRIRKINGDTGEVTTIAGTGEKGYKDGDALKATFNEPTGIAIDNQNNIIVADQWNHRIRMISQGQVTTIAGCGKLGCKDGDSKNSVIENPMAIAVNYMNEIIIADKKNHRIRKLTKDGKFVVTITGGQKGYKDGEIEVALFNEPMGIAVDGDVIIVADHGNSRIRMINLATGQVSTVAGSGKSGFKDDSGTNAMFVGPTGVTFDDSRDIVVADFSSFEHRIRKIALHSKEEKKEAKEQKKTNKTIDSFLKEIGLEKYAAVFKKEGITLEVMSEFNIQTLKETLNIPLGDGAKIVQAVKNL